MRKLGKLWVEIVKFGRNCEIWLEMWNFVGITKVGKKYEIWSKLTNLVKIVKFGKHCEIWSMWNFVGIAKVGKNYEIWSKLTNLVKIVKFGKHCEIWSKLWNCVHLHDHNHFMTSATSSTVNFSTSVITTMSFHRFVRSSESLTE